MILSMKGTLVSNVTILYWSFICNMKRPLWSKSKTWNEFKFSNDILRYTTLHETASDRRWSLHWSMSSMRAHSKQMAELGQVFRWSAQLGQLVRWSTQISSQIYPPVSDEVHTETQIFRWSVQIQIYPPVFRWSAQMKYALRPKHKIRKWVHIFRWSVQISCQIYPHPPKTFRWCAHWDPNLKWGNEFIFSDEVSR